MCCFCGGEEPGTSIDHVPSRQMFSLRHRPKGLEFPACQRCNKGTAGHEQVAAMLARVYPDPVSKEEQKEVKKIMLSVKRQQPFLFAEMAPSWRQQYDYQQSMGADSSGGPMNASGPLLNRSIMSFGAKLSLALHYEETGKIIPATGGVAVRWYTNWDRMRDKIPQTLFTLVGGPKSLQQGRLSVREQFEYSHASNAKENIGLYVATFRSAFMTVGFVAEDVSILTSIAPESDVFRPGQDA